jgi:hypothetical protein
MRDLVLYEWYDRSKVIEQLRTGGEPQSFCDGQWVIYPHLVICFAEVGESPTASHFTSGRQFCWVAQKPYQGSDDQHLKFVPTEVVSRHADRPIRLFVRPIHSDKFLYAGDLEPACRFMISGKANCGEAYFTLSPAFPSGVWGELGGLKIGNLDHSAIDAALDRLREPTTIEDRLWVLERLVTYWHGEIQPEDGYSEEELKGLAIPDPLRWWYRRAGRRQKILSGQNLLLAPDKLLIRDKLLVFYGENQWCYEWGTVFHGEDPPVFGRESSTDPWEQEGIVLSEHLILACLFEATMCHSPYGASASWLREAVLSRIIEHIPPIAINPWRWGGSGRFYAKGGAFMYTMPNGEIDGEQGYSVCVGAQTEHPLHFLKPFIDKDWEYVAV